MQYLFQLCSTLMCMYLYLCLIDVPQWLRLERMPLARVYLEPTKQPTEVAFQTKPCSDIGKYQLPHLPHEMRTQ